MYFKLLFITSLLFSLPFLASAQIKPGPSGVVCVIDGDESPAALASDPGWKNPRVQGLLIRESWASLEPSEGSYDFTLFDEAAQLARQNGKFIGLGVGAGSLSPSWLYSAGAHSMFFAKAAGQSQAMPVPWDPIFQSAWASTIEALGNRYDTNPAVAYVAVSGVGRDYSTPLALTADDVSKFDALGGELFWSHAASDIADVYATSFPHTQIIFPMEPAIPGALGDKWLDSVASGGLESHAGQFGLAATSSAEQGQGPVASVFSSGAGAQSALGMEIDSPQNLPQAFSWFQRSGLPSRTTFMEMSAHNMSWPEIQAALAQAGSQLAGRLRADRAHRRNHVSSTTPPGGGGSTATGAPTGGGTSVATTPSGGESSTTGSSDTTPPNGAPTGGGKSVATSTSGSNGSTSSSSSTTAAATAAEAAICVNIQAAAWAAHLKGQPIWLSAANTDSIGTGTESDPINVPTSDRLYAALFFFSSNLVPNLIFHFLPGTYYTMGDVHIYWGVSTGWQFLGSGEGSTILKLDKAAMTYTSTNKYGDNKQVISTNGSGNILVKDMTLDGNATGFGSQLTASFVMPAPRATVTVDVANSSAYTVGKWVYVQDSVPTGGLNLYYGLMDVVAIPSATQVTLRNCEVATPGTVTGTLTSGSPVITGVSSTADLDEGQSLSGAGIPAGTTILSAADGVVTLSANATASGAHEDLSYGTTCVLGQVSWFCPGGNVEQGTTIPSTAHVLVAACVGGIGAGRTNDTIENITVQNVGRPFYEGPIGIGLNGFNQCIGSLLQDCTVKDIWGTSSWIISLTETNGVTLIGNTIVGNGYSQGYSLVGDNSNAIISDNTAVNVTSGLFSDTGTKTNFTFTGNSFQSMNGIALMGASFGQSTFNHNTILVTRNYGFAMAFAGVQLTDCTFSDNTIRVTPGLIDPRGISLSSSCAGSTGNVFSDNVIDSAAQNISASPSYGTQSGNVDENGDEVSLGLNE